ncbi:hypothetical protein V6C20_03860 [Caldibacillus thermoamylovorans]
MKNRKKKLDERNNTVLDGKLDKGRAVSKDIDFAFWTATIGI